MGCQMSNIPLTKIEIGQLAQTQKLAAVGLLLSSITHEINNLNNSIIFNTPILREYLKELLPIIDNYAENHEGFELLNIPYTELREDIFKIVDAIESASQRVAATESRLREFSRGKANENQRWTDLKQIINNVLLICRGEILERVKSLKVNIAEDLPLIFVDCVSLELVLINFLINAVQATNKKNSWIMINVKQDRSLHDHLIVEISDNGCGIEEEIKGKIFEPFFTTKAPTIGAGLGLFINKILVEGFGGGIEVDSYPDKGSTFRVILRCELESN